MKYWLAIVFILTVSLPLEADLFFTEYIIGSGVYYVRLVSSNDTWVQKILLINKIDHKPHHQRLLSGYPAVIANKEDLSI